MTPKRPVSDHFDGETFFNPTIEQRSSMGMLKGLSLWLFQDKAVWPKDVKNKAPAQLPSAVAKNQVAITFVNHASFLIQMENLNILTDPVWSKRVSPFSFLGPARVRPPGIDFEQLPKIDVVLISHNHYDHMDRDTLLKLEQKFAPKFFVALGDAERARSWGLKNVQEMDWWDSAQILETVKITFAPTQHFSSRGLFDRNHSLWGSYMIERGGKRLYFGGDAGYSKHYKTIHERMGDVDIALLAIGAYLPREFMKPMHTNPAEAVQAHLDLHSKQSIGMHFGTFQLSSEEIDQPQRDLETALKDAGLSENAFITVSEGSTHTYAF